MINEETVTKSQQNKLFFPEDLPRFSGEACKDALFSQPVLLDSDGKRLQRWNSDVGREIRDFMPLSSTLKVI